jgi:hypothetical protein
MTIQARLTPPLIQALFAEALTLEFGIRLPIEAAYHDRARTMISAAMKGNPDRERVMVCAFPTDDELWFVKKTVEIEI